MLIRFTASCILLLPLGNRLVAQGFNQVILGDTAARIAKELVVPQDEVWLLSEFGPDCFVLLNTTSGARVSIASNLYENDPKSVLVSFEPKPQDIEVEVIMFYTKLPLLLPPSTLMTYETGPNQRIVFRTTGP